MRFVQLVTGTFLALAAIFGGPVVESEARPTCAGKKATIVSNAPRIVGTKGHDVIVAGPRNNVIFGEGGNDVICGGGGDDRIHGGRGNDTIYGQGGNDTIHGERGSDRLFGGAGSDHIFGETGNDVIDGGSGDHDRVDGGPGDDTVSGGAGDFDLVIGGIGIDRIDGGPGAHDIVSYKGVGGPITINLQAGRTSGAEAERLSGIEDAIGGSGDDTLRGAPGTVNRLDGGPGDDRLYAAGEGDVGFGGPGRDHCSGRFAAQESCDDGGLARASSVQIELYRSIAGETSLVVTGTERADRIVVAAAQVGSARSIVASLGGGDDFFEVAPDVPARVSATIDGGKGSDTLRGGPGNDVLYGGDDRDPDTLEGGPGDDALFGINIFHPRRDSGAARMIGGPGNDLMVGGQPCNGDLFDGGPGDNDSASFARVRNSGIHVHATIGGAVFDPDISNCDAGRIDSSVEKIEGSPGPDILIGNDSHNVIEGRGGNDLIDGKGGIDRCVGGGGRNRTVNCEMTDWRTPLRQGIRQYRRARR